MSRPPGIPKSGGRTMGTPNRRSLVLRDQLEELGLLIPERIVKLLPKLSPDRQMSALLYLLQFIYPRRKMIDASPEETGRMTLADLVMKVERTRQQELSENSPKNSG